MQTSLVENHQSYAAKLCHICLCLPCEMNNLQILYSKIDFQLPEHNKNKF